jgi:hypothetical protein
MTNTNKKILKIVSIAFLILAALAWRIVNHSYNFAPNLELITMTAVLSSIILGYRAAIIAPILTIIASDLIIGNSSIFIFTWGSFAIIGVCATLIRKLNRKPTKQIIASAGFAVASSFIFFVVTNLGVWLQGWYPATLTGLMTCFTLAIPFYRTMLIGNLIIIPASVAIYQIVRVKILAKYLVVNTTIS